MPEIGAMFAPDSVFAPDLVIEAVAVVGRSGVNDTNSPNDVTHDPSATMLSRVAILSALSVAIYSKKPEAWNLFYVTVGIATLRFIVNLIAIRRKLSKLVPLLTRCAKLMIAWPTAFNAVGSHKMDWARNGKEADRN